jgi:hypothetical protein
LFRLLCTEKRLRDFLNCSVRVLTAEIGCVTCYEEDGSDNSEEEEEELPDHKFITNNNPFKSGPRKG